MSITTSLEDVHLRWAICDDFKYGLLAIGVRIEHIYPSDLRRINGRLCFDGWVENWEKFLKTLGYDNSVLINHARIHWSFSAICKGRPSHMNCIHYNSYLPMPIDFATDIDVKLFIEKFGPYKDEFRDQAWMAALSQFSRVNFRKKFTTIFRQYKRRLSLQLRLEKTK